MARHANRLPGSFEERCLAVANKREAEANDIPAGDLRDEMLRNARQMRVAADLEKWLSSPGLMPPT